MDVAALRECISQTLQANADIRRHAELQLKQACLTEPICVIECDINAFDRLNNLRASSAL